jgi:cobyrinic acid a,c-diamide synthase
MVNLPRLVIAAPASGHGKTTVATGLMAALSRRGLTVSGHKVGPDYIDPGYHALATGRPGRNLDPHLVGEERLVPLLLHGAQGADLALIEGVMGLYDGQLGGRGFASTAHVATVTRTPVLLVVDISHASRTIGAVVRGLAGGDPGGAPGVDVVGVLLNKAGSPRHAAEVEAAVTEATGLPLLGVLHRDDGIVAPSRHLGLVPAAERDEAAATLDRLVDRITERVDLDQVLALAGKAPDLDGVAWDPAAEVTPRCCNAELGTPPQPPEPVEAFLTPRYSSARPVVAVAGGRAFTFRYAETEELLAAVGCDVVTFDPLTDPALPEGTAGIYLGGGFPEVHAAGLAANASLREDLRAAIAAGVPTVAECAGLLYLCDSVDGVPMIGALLADAAMTPRLTLAYRTAAADADTLLTRAGEQVTAHEFHRTAVTPATSGDAAWKVDGSPVGFASATLHASYLHVHWAGHPHLAQRFADAVHRAEPWSRGLETDLVPRPSSTNRGSSTIEGSDPLRHHGDAELAPGLADFAVNVYDGPRPDWLDRALHAALDDVERYPDAKHAERAIARRHGRRPGEVLATAGAAEAFTLIARLRDWQRPVVVHPQFTEPDVALIEAGHQPTRVILDDDFSLTGKEIPDDADLVMIGNPTNPTGVLHPAGGLRQLIKPGRLVVVDEAFIDFVPGERESLADQPVPGLVVIRSLTKLWSIPGVRAGYVLAEPAVIEGLKAKQTPWSVSTLAAAAMVACTSGDAVAEQQRRAAATVTHRKVLTDGLTELGIETVPSEAPYVLARLGTGARDALRDKGLVARRADTFPGLDDTWARIAVRTPVLSRQLLSALAGL